MRLEKADDDGRFLRVSDLLVSWSQARLQEEADPHGLKLRAGALLNQPVSSTDSRRRRKSQPHLLPAVQPQAHCSPSLSSCLLCEVGRTAAPSS